MPTFSVVMDDLASIIFEWFKLTPMVGVLLVVMFLDIVSGVIVAIANKTLNSTVSMIGMSRKVLMILLVGVAAVIEPHAADDVPLTKLVSAFFVASEVLSIVENAIKIGLPVPKILKDTLAKFRDTQEAVIVVPEQTIHGRVKRPSDVVELPQTVPKQADDSEGGSPPSRPS